MEKQLEDTQSLFSLHFFTSYQEILFGKEFRRAGLPSCSLEFILQALAKMSQAITPELEEFRPLSTIQALN